MVVLALLGGASGCATTELAAGAKNVRMVSQEQAKRCKFIDAVSTNNTNTLSKNPELDARNKALNQVAQRGGNALYIKTTNTQIAPSGVGALFLLSGEAYTCP
jgi:hypothetical protein